MLTSATSRSKLYWWGAVIIGPAQFARCGKQQQMQNGEAQEAQEKEVDDKKELHGYVKEESMLRRRNSGRVTLKARESAGTAKSPEPKTPDD